MVNSRDRFDKEAIELENFTGGTAIKMDPKPENHKDYNVGTSDYSKHKIQPWDLWREYSLNPWDADIIKRVLRSKEGANDVEEYKKIIHVCRERIAQLEGYYD